MEELIKEFDFFRSVFYDATPCTMIRVLKIKREIPNLPQDEDDELLDFLSKRLMDEEVLPKRIKNPLTVVRFIK